MAARKLPSMSPRFSLNSSTGQPKGTTVRSSWVGIAAQPRRSSVANRGLEPYARQIAPVGVVHRHLRAPLVVLLGLNRLRDEGVLAVGADHYSGALGDALASLCVPANAGHDSIVGEDLLDREPLAELDAGLDRGVDEQLVEHRAPRAVSVGDPVDRLRRTGDRQRSEVERVGRHRWASGLLESLQQTPALERSQARWMHVVRRHRVARKGRLVDHQHSMAAAGKQHRRRRSRAARPHDDRVIASVTHALAPLTLVVGWSQTRPSRYRRFPSASQLKSLNTECPARSCVARNAAAPCLSPCVAVESDTWPDSFLATTQLSLGLAADVVNTDRPPAPALREMQQPPSE